MHAATDSSTQPSSSPTPIDFGPAVSLPARRLFAMVMLSGGAVAAGWLIACMVGPWEPVVQRSGLLAIGLTLVVSMLGILVLSPWKKRDIQMWMTFWLGATVFRLLVTPGVAWGLYSATKPDIHAKAFALGVAITYMVALFVEAGTVSAHLKKMLDAPKRATR